MGRLLSCIAQRYSKFNGQYAIQTWATPTTDYGTFNSTKSPAAGLGVWRLPDGDLPYVNVGLTDILYNQPIVAF